MKNNEIGKLLKNIRESRNLTQEEVGKKIKIGRDAMQPYSIKILQMAV